MTDESLKVPRGHFVVTTYGQITVETFTSYADTRVHCAKVGLDDIQWPVVSGLLVDKARNEAVLNFMSDTKAGWLMFMDADMQWDTNLLPRLLKTAFQDCTWASIVGGYCNLKGDPYLPTMDLGSGTWEPIEPGLGPQEVMRTGGACVLIKRCVFEKMEAPWYGVRPAPRAIDMMLEVDNFANQKFDGTNPLRRII